MTTKTSDDHHGRDELIAAASQLFADRGYTGTTTTAIARRAGVSQPLLYHHFGSKKGLWRAVIDTLFGQLKDELDRVTHELAKMPRPQRLAELLRAFVRFSGHHPELARLIRTESGGGGDAFDDLYGRWLEDLVSFFNGELTAAHDDDTLRPIDPTCLYFIIVGAATEPFVQPEIARRNFGLDPTDDGFIDRYADAMVDALLRGVLAG